MCSPAGSKHQVNWSWCHKFFEGSHVHQMGWKIYAALPGVSYVSCKICSSKLHACCPEEISDWTSVGCNYHLQRLLTCWLISPASNVMHAHVNFIICSTTYIFYLLVLWEQATNQKYMLVLLGISIKIQASIWEASISHDHLTISYYWSNVARGSSRRQCKAYSWDLGAVAGWQGCAVMASARCACSCMWAIWWGSTPSDVCAWVTRRPVLCCTICYLVFCLAK